MQAISSTSAECKDPRDESTSHGPITAQIWHVVFNSHNDEQGTSNLAANFIFEECLSLSWHICI
jgi:hypothetical protein